MQTTKQQLVWRWGTRTQIPLMTMCGAQWETKKQLCGASAPGAVSEKNKNNTQKKQPQPKALNRNSYRKRANDSYVT